ncbi:MAG TPA: hypothetical protein VL634_02955 [Mycobacterium sp.]|nr:hypothetical protein [Mycobacterium sp.]
MKQISVALALACLVLAGCSATGTSPQATSSTPAMSPATPAVQRVAAHGDEAAITEVPWSQVGAGWTLATWNPATPTRGGDEPVGEPAPDTLFLVSPEGGRYKITTFAARAENESGPMLVDWSGDGTRALFYNRRRDNSTDVIQVDLHTGAQTSFNVKQFDVTPRYSRPEGKAVLLAKSNDVDNPASLVRVDLAGNHQLTYPIEQFGSKSGPDFLSTPDGTRLVLGTEAGGLAVMGNDGVGAKTLPVPGQQYCGPTRWWDADSTITVADCHDAQYSSSQLWLVPIDGSAPTLLTQPDNAQEGEVLDVGNAWKLPEGTFVQAYGGCGYRFLAKVDTFGETPTKVSVPNIDEHRSVGVIGVYHGNLELQASLSCGDGESLLSYDPGTGTSTVLLGAPLNGGGVVAALPYPGDE